MSDTLQQLADELKQIQGALATSRKATDEAVAAKNGSETILPAAQRESDDAKTRYEAAKKDLDAKTQALASGQAGLTAKTTARDTAKAALETAITTLNTTNTAYSSAQAKLDGVESTLRQELGEAEGAHQNLTQSQTAFGKKKQELDAIQSQINQLQQEVNSAEQLVDNAQTEVNLAQDKLAKARGVLAITDDRLVGLNSQLATFQAEKQYVDDLVVKAIEEKDQKEKKGQQTPQQRQHFLEDAIKRLKSSIASETKEQQNQANDVEKEEKSLKDAYGLVAVAKQALDDAAQALENELSVKLPAASAAVETARKDVDAKELVFNKERNDVTTARTKVEAERAIFISARDARNVAQVAELSKQQNLTMAQRELDDEESKVAGLEQSKNLAEVVSNRAELERDESYAALKRVKDTIKQADDSIATEKAKTADLKAKEAKKRADLSSFIQTSKPSYELPTRPSLLRPIFRINPPPTRLARVVSLAMTKFVADATSDTTVVVTLPAGIQQGGVRSRLECSGRSSEILRVSEELNAGNHLDDLARLVLSREDVYLRLLVHSIEKRGDNYSDRVGIIETIIGIVEEKLRPLLIKLIIQEVFAENQLGDPRDIDAVSRQLASAVLPLGEGAVQNRVLAAYKVVNQRSKVAEYIVLYLHRKGLMEVA